MNPRQLLLSQLFVLVVASVVLAETHVWNQFRGPQAQGIAGEGQRPPIEFGLDKNLVWKLELPSGHGSPSIWGHHLFLTAYDEAKRQLQVIGVDRTDGTIKWRKTFEPEEIERVHGKSSPASATPATDGREVYSYFGSIGLVCHDINGNQKWQLPLPNPKVMNGSGTSPAISDELVFLNREGVDGHFLLAVNRATGEIAWQRDHGPARMALAVKRHRLFTPTR